MSSTVTNLANLKKWIADHNMKQCIIRDKLFSPGTIAGKHKCSVCDQEFTEGSTNALQHLAVHDNWREVCNTLLGNVSGPMDSLVTKKIINTKAVKMNAWIITIVNTH